MAETLSIEEAEGIVRDFRGEHGLGARYALSLEPAGPGRWRVQPHDQKAVEVDAMTRDDWVAWLERFFVEPIFEHDKTTEG